MIRACGGAACLAAGLALLLAPARAAASSLGQFPNRVTEFTLANGLHVIVLHRAESPTVSFHLLARGGWAGDPRGQRGISRLLEKSVREGALSTGSSNPQAERQAWAALDAAYDAYQAEIDKGSQSDLFRSQRLRSDALAAAGKAEAFSKPESLAGALTQFGGARFDTLLLADSFSVSATLPVTEAERWFTEISAWIAEPSFRRFFAHRVQVAQKASEPGRGAAHAGLLAAAFGPSGYGLPDAIPDEVMALRVPDARRWHARLMSAKNLTLVTAGGLSPDRVRSWAEAHLGKLAAGARFEPDAVPAAAPQTRRNPAGSPPDGAAAAVGYRRPGVWHEDDPALDVIQQVLTAGPLARGLTSGRRLIAPASSIEVRAATPGSERPSLFAFIAHVNPAWRLEEVEKAMAAVLTELTEKPAPAATVEAARNRLYALALRQLDDNASAAALLALNHAAYGKWSRLGEVLDTIRGLTPEQLQAVAARHFTPANRVVWRSDGVRRGAQPAAAESHAPAQEPAKP
jgi:predicted Zn-dependent peptidase